MHSNYRGGQDWRKLGLPMTTGSDEACKMYDAALTQLLAWNDDDNLGGVEGTINKMKQADPNFVMGSVVVNWMGLVSSTQCKNPDDDISDDLKKMVSLAENTPGITDREKMHARAIELWAHGRRDKALDMWEDILVLYPLDMTAIIMAFNNYFFNGKFEQMRDSLARVLPHWTPDMPHYGYLLGLKAFSLEETQRFAQAEATAKQSLDINPYDSWSTHTMCHILESSGRQGEVIDMLENTQDNWLFGKDLACHNYWHWGLNHIEMGDYESALSVLDNQLSKSYASSGSTFHLTDVASMLYRLEFEGVNVEDRWYTMSDSFKNHMYGHTSLFRGIHVFMACVNGDKDEEDLAGQMLASMQDFIRNNNGLIRDVHASVGETLAKALVAYNDKDYSTVVDLVRPIRYKIRDMGGSNTQRDIFNLFLIHAAMRSPRKEDNKLARNLLNERKAYFGNSPMTDRLLAKILAAHDD